MAVRRQGGGKRERETFRARFAIINTDLAEGTFEGYASVFGSLVDTWPPTVVEPGAFQKTLSEQKDKDRVRILYQHDPYRPIGRPTSMEEDDKGLHVVAKISDTELGREALTLLRDGVLNEMSIGFDAIQWEMQADPLAPNDPARMVRHLKEVRLWEVSLVTWGADPMAQVYSVHALAAAPPAHRWQREAADARVRAWAGRFQEERPTKPVQTVICAKDTFDSADAAREWVRDHDFRADKMDETDESYRFRQFDPADCEDGSQRTIELTDGVKAVICAKKEADRSGGPAATAESQRLGRYSRACLAGHLVADVVDDRLRLVPVAVLEAGAALVLEQCKAMTADEAKRLLREAKAALDQVLEAAGMDDEVPDDPDDDKKQKRTDGAQGRVDHRLLELEAEAALLGVY